jgi:hypothetical protein
MDRKGKDWQQLCKSFHAIAQTEICLQVLAESRIQGVGSADS